MKVSLSNILIWFLHPTKVHFPFTGFKQKFRQTSRCALTFQRELQPPLCWQTLLWEPQISRYRMVYRPVCAIASSCLQPPIIVLWYPNTDTLRGYYGYLVALEVTYSGAEATQKYSITSHQVFMVVTVFSDDTTQLEKGTNISEWPDAASLDYEVFYYYGIPNGSSKN